MQHCSSSSPAGRASSLQKTSQQIIISSCEILKMEMKFLLLLFDRRCWLGVGLSCSHQRWYQTKLMMLHDRNDTHLDDNPRNYNKYFAIIHIQTDTCCNAGILFLSGKASIVTFRLAVRSKAKLCFYFIANLNAGRVKVSMSVKLNSGRISSNLQQRVM